MCPGDRSAVSVGHQGATVPKLDLVHIPTADSAHILFSEKHFHLQRSHNINKLRNWKVRPCPTGIFTDSCVLSLNAWKCIISLKAKVTSANKPTTVILNNVKEGWQRTIQRCSSAALHEVTDCNQSAHKQQFYFYRKVTLVLLSFAPVSVFSDRLSQRFECTTSKLPS